MGLDMYLSKRTYVKNWEHQKPEEQHQVLVRKNNVPVSHIKPERVKEIVEDVGYWRKANAIHDWFIKNVQDGDDDCGEHYVDREKLEELLQTVNKVLAASKLVDGEVNNGYTFDGSKKVYNKEQGKIIADPTVAKELLPTTEGFFFGSTDYDQYYYDDLVQTKEILENALKDEEGDFYYHASW